MSGGSSVESIKPKYPTVSAVLGVMFLALHFMGFSGAWSRGFSAGYMLDLDYGGIARMFGAVVGANIFAWGAVYMGLRMRPTRAGNFIIVASIAGILLGFIPQYGATTRYLFANGYANSSSPSSTDLYWSGRTRERELAEALDSDPNAKDIAEATGYADTGILERIGGAIMRLRQGVVYNAVRHADGIGQTMGTLSIPPSSKILESSEKFLISHPELRP